LILTALPFNSFSDLPKRGYQNLPNHKIKFLRFWENRAFLPFIFATLLQIKRNFAKNIET